MTKKFLVVASLSAALLHGMEPIENGMATKIETISLLGITKTSLHLAYNGTKINLIKGSWEDATDTMDITIVGNQQQRMLQEEFNGIGTIGDTYPSYCTTGSIYKRKKDDESASDDDTYKPYRQIDKQTWRNAQKTKKYIMYIEEPRINFITKSEKLCINNSTQSDCTDIKEYISQLNESELKLVIARLNGLFNTFVYNCHRPVPNSQDTVYILCFKGNQAIQEAIEDLNLCYYTALAKGLKYFQYHSKKNKNIAFPTLGADVGVPRDKAVPIAVQAVFDFLQVNPDQYESINLFVKKRSEFALYKKLLMEYYKPIKAIQLLYLMHKDAVEPFSTVPHDVIDYIARLMYNS